MDYGGKRDFKRASAVAWHTGRNGDLSAPAPEDLKNRSGTADWFYDLRGSVRLLWSTAALLPLVAIIGLGTLILRSAETGSTSFVVATSFVAGGVATALINWSRAVAQESASRSQLRLHIGFTSDLGFADFSDLRVAGAYFRNRRLAGAKFSRAEFKHADFTDADLDDARLTGGNFRHSRFRGASLVGAGLYRAIVNDCDFRGANLARASLVGANLRNSKLQGVNFRGADLRYADLRGALLSDTPHLDQAVVNRGTKPPSSHELALLGRRLVLRQKEESQEASQSQATGIGAGALRKLEQLASRHQVADLRDPPTSVEDIEDSTGGEQSLAHE